MNKLKFVLGVALLATWIWIGICAQARAQFNGDGGFVVQNQSLVAVPKVSLFPEDAGNPVNYMRSQDYNQLYSAVYDTRTWLFNSNPLQAFGAVCDGITDVSTFLTTAAAQGGTIQITNGVCAVNQNVTIPAGVSLLFTDIGQLKISMGKTLTVLGSIQAPPNRQIFITALTDPAPVRFGVWNSSGVPNTSAGVQKDYAQWFGAAADGGGDDAPPIQQAIYAWGWYGDGGTLIGSTGEVDLLQGPYNLQETLNFQTSGVRFAGAGLANVGYNGTMLFCAQAGSAPCLQVGNPVNGDVLNYAEFDHFAAIGTAGPIIKTGSAVLSLFHDLKLLQFNPASHIIELNANTQAGFEVQQVTFRKMSLALGSSYNASAIYIEAGTGLDVSEIQFDDILVSGTAIGANRGSKPLIELHENGTSVDCANIDFNEVRAEQPSGGMLYNYGCRNVSLRHSLDADLIGVIPVPLILIAQGGDAGAPFINETPNNMEFSEDAFFDGTNANPCVLITSLSAGFFPPTFENSYCYGPIQVNGTRPTLINSSFPLSDAGGFVMNFNNQSAGITGITGISATNIPTLNMSGSFTLAAGASQAIVVLPLGEEDANYLVQVTMVGGAALPDAGASVIGSTKIIQTTAGFTFQVQTPPAQNTTFYWFLYR